MDALLFMPEHPERANALARHRAGGKRQYGLALLRICYRIVLILKVELRRATTSRRMKESPNTYKSRSVNTGRSAEMRYDI